MEEDTVPPAALTASTAIAFGVARAARSGSPADDRADEAQSALALTARPRLRLVSTIEPLAVTDGPAPEVHGRGGPSSCGCRDCAMARHPAAMPRLAVVR
ncbi:hypothetical protein [Candidatus Frankia nodulisporulans]|uniref:hypothetical protein n=1 Tax=Candidatus Frankia nodulisporulans TaxID=2060052 RepID=UPI001FD5AF3D|nr:hypothetical protein [Candidatus Frankia nodulisporulans]